MVNKKNSEYSRAPEFEDLISLCRSLNRSGARYILIGGFAVILHGYVRGTKDIDLLVDASEENVQKLKKALASLPDNAIRMIKNDEIEKYAVVRIADEFVIDLMEKACGIDYNEASKYIEFKEIEGVRIPIPKKELLIRMKNTIRPSDKADANFLRVLIEEEKKS
jgi:acylphosphatase